MTSHAFVLESCPKCNGTGVCHHAKHFFYGICLIAAGVLCFFDWPPTPALFALIWDGTARLGLPSWIGSIVMWAITGVPVVLGLGFIYTWLKADTCPACNGRRKTTRIAADPVP